MRDQKKHITKKGFEIIFNEGLRSFTVDRLSSVLRMILVCRVVGMEYLVWIWERMSCTFMVLSLG